MAAPWGSKGHEIAALAAGEGLPRAMPAFFREAVRQLAYLGSEPDRWRDRDRPEMDEAWRYDHYIDLERVPAGALEAADRFTFLRRLYEAGHERPEGDVGILPFRIVELYQRLVTEWRLWRSEGSPERRAWIEARILDDAGILGHYVTDAANPHHTTIHFNGWDDTAPNPEGYTTDRRFHQRFETDFVSRHVRLPDVRSGVTGPPTSVVGNVREAVRKHLEESHGLVAELYRLERDVGFDPAAEARADARAFVIERLSSGAEMLRTLWWSAWLEAAAGGDGDPRSDRNLAQDDPVVLFRGGTMSSGELTGGPVTRCGAWCRVPTDRTSEGTAHSRSWTPGSTSSRWRTEWTSRRGLGPASSPGSGTDRSGESS
jgi:hypothetical protein